MAYQELFKMSIQDESGAYYTATQNTDASWLVGTTVSTITPLYLNDLPDGWDETALTYERDLSYLGVFRTMTNGSYKFSKDARAIIQYIRSIQGIKGFGRLTIWIINTNDFNYSVFYKSNLNFRTYHDFEQIQLLEIATLEAGVIKDFHAYGDTKFNLPIWRPNGLGGWVTDASFCLHDGIKLLYNATFINGASQENPWNPGGIEGFNKGRHATSGVNMGKHTLPALANFNITQNNGTTTFIGNDILANLLLQGNQAPGASNQGGINELNFSGANESQPYNRNNFSLKNAMPFPTNTFKMSVAVSGRFSNPTVTYNDNGNPVFIGFVLFEIDAFDDPITIAGRYTYQLISQVIMPSGGSPYTFVSQDFSNYSAPVTVDINPNKAYVFGIVYDEATAGTGGGLTGDGSKFAVFGFTALQFSLFSLYDDGLSGFPIPAPQLNPSAFPAFRFHQLWEKVIPNLATRQTDGYGFPIPVVTDYVGTSDILSNPVLPAIADCVPWQILVTSSFCVHALQGQSYISVSANQIFDFCKKQLGCGMGVVYDADGVGIGLRIEDLRFFFDNTTMILDLGYDISDYQVLQGGEEMGIGADLKLGYQKADTNTDFGVTPFITGLFFNTPVSEIPGTMDYEEDGILCEENAIEKIRAQRVSQPIGSSFDPASPSDDNQTIALYCLPSPTTWIGTPSFPNPTYPGVVIIDPDNNIIGVGTPATPEAYQLVQYNGVNLPAAQSTNPTALTNPYIKGLHYPDTAINTPLSPCRALGRSTGALIHSVLDKMDPEYLTFRNTYVMQMNNTTSALIGISSKLDIGTATTAITEMSDKLIGDLPPKLFLPVKVQVTSTSGRNLYSILNTNPNGYIRFFVQNQSFGYTERKMFLTKATQKATLGGNIATVFEGWLTPDQII